MKPVDEIVADNRLTDCAKLVAVLLAQGHTERTEIAAVLGKSVRTVEAAFALLGRLEYVKTRKREYAKSRNKEYVNTRNHVDEYANSRNGTEIATRAPKELPNGNTLPLNTNSMHACSAREGEIEGLNGSTGAFVTQLATALAGPMGSPDFLTAKIILESNVRSFGAERVRVAMAEWSVRVQTDKKFKATPSSFGKFVQNAKTGASDGKKPDQDAAAFQKKLELIAGVTAHA